MRRFTDTQKWEDPWFYGLPTAHKALFICITDKCNNAGFLELNPVTLAGYTGIELSQLKPVLMALGKGLVIVDGWIWVRRFLRHQNNESLNPKNPYHRQIIGQIRQQIDRFSKCSEFIHFLTPYKGLVRPLSIGMGIGITSLGEVQENPFLKPTLEEATAYGVEIGMARDKVSDWYDYYEARGWVLGGANGSPMKDWKASVRFSKKRAATPSANGSTETPKPKKFFYLCPPGDLKDEG